MQEEIGLEEGVQQEVELEEGVQGEPQEGGGSRQRNIVPSTIPWQTADITADRDCTHATHLH